MWMIYHSLIISKSTLIKCYSVKIKKKKKLNKSSQVIKMQISCRYYSYRKNSICQAERFADDFYSIRREYEKFAADSLTMYDSSPAELSQLQSAATDWKTAT